MTRDGIRLLLGLQRFTKDRHVDIAQSLDLHHRHSLLDQLLLDLGNVHRAHVLQ